MKTFRVFILEATIQELRAKARMLRQKGDMEGALEVEKQAGELQQGTQDKIRDLTGDNPRSPSNPNSITGGGYAQTGRSRRARIDPDTLRSQPNIAHPDDDEEARSNSVVAGRYSDPRKGTGMKSTLRNRGTSRTGDTLG